MSMTKLASVEKGMFPNPEGDCVPVSSAAGQIQKKKHIKIWDSTGKGLNLFCYAKQPHQVVLHLPF